MSRDPSASVSVAVDSGVFLPAGVCRPVWLALRRELDRHRADGGQVRPEIVAAMEALRTAALTHMSPQGRDPRTSADIGAPCLPELITTEQLATRLGVTARHARRLAARAGITPAARDAWRRDDVRRLVAQQREATI